MTFARAASLTVSALRAASALAFLHSPSSPASLSSCGTRRPTTALRSEGDHAGRSLSSAAAPVHAIAPTTSGVPPPANCLRERFRAGDFYIWLYRDGDGSPTSWEKYTVTESGDDGVVAIEMSTKFSEEDDYFTHHRMTVDMAHHLESYQDRTVWRLGFEYRTPEGEDDEEWAAFGPGDNVQAFEEKFDVFTMLETAERTSSNCTSARRKCCKVCVGSEEIDVTLVRTARHDYTGAWYWYSPNEDVMLSGVAVFKAFSEHSFSLIRSGRGPKQKDIQVRA